MKQQFIDRIKALPDVFMLASLVQFKYVQTISELNDVNFVVGLAGGYEVFGTPEHYNKFMDKYLTWARESLILCYSLKKSFIASFLLYAIV